MSGSDTRRDVTRWLSIPRPNPRARIRLVCFPYAGGSASVFRPWVEALPDFVELCAVQLPGRGSRLGEPAMTRTSAIAAEAAHVIAASVDRPYAFFGHSMGAVLAYEVARILEASGAKGPARLIVAGRRAPHLPNDETPSYALPERELIDELRTLDGTPEEFFEHPELVELMLPILRADFEVCQTYELEGDESTTRLACPITALGGLRDRVTREQIAQWARYTRSDFSLSMFPGGHFFINTERPAVVNAITRALYAALEPR